MQARKAVASASILWDNRCCMHYRSEVDVTQRRVMHRTTIKGEPLIAA